MHNGRKFHNHTVIPHFLQCIKYLLYGVNRFRWREIRLMVLSPKIADRYKDLNDKSSSSREGPLLLNWQTILQTDFFSYKGRCLVFFPLKKMENRNLFCVNEICFHNPFYSNMADFTLDFYCGKFASDLLNGKYSKAIGKYWHGWFFGYFMRLLFEINRALKTISFDRRGMLSIFI